MSKRLTENEIRTYEEMGLDVIVTGSEGKLEYATKMNNNHDYCDSCENLRFSLDPDSDDWFHDQEQKAICMKVNKKIVGALEPYEMTGITKPPWCPKLKQ